MQIALDLLWRKKYYEAGLVYFFLMIALEMVLPEWVGDENGIIENLQLLWLAAGFYYCYRARKYTCEDWGGDAASLWNAGMIYFFLLFMREISWGRTLLHNTDGSMVQYSQLGLYGQMVHPLVGLLIMTLLLFLYKARVWRMLRRLDFPVAGFILLLVFIFASWVGEKSNFLAFHGQVAEELAEFGAYMMMYFLLADAGRQLKINNK